MFHSDIETAIQFLRTKIQNYERHIKLLEELRDRRNSNGHDPELIERRKGSSKIISVTCSCGRKTDFKRPLNKIEDFQCPGEKNARKVQSS